MERIEPAGAPRLAKEAAKPSFAAWCVFERDEHRADPFAPDCEALQDARSGEQQGRCDTDLVVSRQRADERRRAAHHQHRRDEHAFAAELVAEVSEDDPAERAGAVPGGKRAEGRDRRDSWRE